MRLRIFHKMLLGYALYLAIGFLFGVYVYGQIGRIITLQSLVEIADDSKEELLELRRSEKNYIIRREPVYLEQIHTAITRLKNLLASFKPDIIKAFGEDDYAVLLELVADYSVRMSEFSRNYRQLTALTEELRHKGREIEALFINANDFRLIREVLEIRLLEKNFVLFMDNDYFHRMKNRIVALRGDLDGAPAQLRLFDSYLETAEKLFQYNFNERALLIEIRKLATNMEEIINQLASRERENIARYVVNSQRLLLGALLALALFGSLLTWFLSKITVAPLQRLEETVRQIAAGDFDLRLEVQGDVETVSLQKSFNTMLDTLDLARESLAKSIQLLQEKSVQLIESEKLASIGILASGVAHEINNPLANISLTAETIQELGDGLSAAELGELVADIIAETERASAVVDNLLGYARSVKDNRTAPRDIRAILQQSIKLVAHELRLHDIDIKQDITDKPLVVDGNKGKLEQVFVNIMLNAVQAMDRTGLLTISARPDESGEFAVIDISDTGPGIPTENLKNIFDPFFTTKAAGEGTGLGLYVSYGIIQEHGGSIGAESIEGSGTTIRIRLPLHR